MIKAELIIDGDLIYCNGLVIQKGGISYFVENSDSEVIEDYVILEQAIKYCMEN